jgi:predicted ATPase
MLEGFRICNFGILNDVTAGYVPNINGASFVKHAPLSPVTVITGHVGSGKSTVIDAFLFLKDCFESNVEYACDSRGLFRNVTDASKLSSIQIYICYREKPESPLFRYYFSVGLDHNHRPFVVEETYGVVDETSQEQTLLLRIENGEGFVGENIPEDEDIKDMREQEKCSKVSLSSNHKLGLSVCGAIEKYSILHSFFDFVRNWRFLQPNINYTRNLTNLCEQRRIDRRVSNLTNVAYYMEQQHPELFAKVVARLSLKNPNIKNVTVEAAPDGMGLMKFWRKDGGVSFPLTVSEGTLKWLAYLLLLYDPEPSSLLFMDESSLDLFSEVKDYKETQIILTMPVRDSVIPSWTLAGEGINILINPHF